MSWDGYIGLGSYSKPTFTESTATGYVRQPFSFGDPHDDLVIGVGGNLSFTTTDTVGAQVDAYAFFNDTFSPPIFVYPIRSVTTFRSPGTYRIHPNNVRVHLSNRRTADDILCDYDPAVLAGLPPAYVPGTTTNTGTGANVLATSPTIVTPILTTPAITGGTMSGVVISGSTITGSSLTTSTLTSPTITTPTITGASLSGSTLTTSTLTSPTITTPTITGGTISSGTTISGSTITTSTLTSPTITTATMTGSALTGGSIDNATVGSTTPAAGAFSTLKSIAAPVETRVAMGASNIDLSAGSVFSKTISGVTTLTISNVAASGSVPSFILELTNGGSSTVNWFSGAKWAGGTAPSLTAAGVDLLGFYTTDGGTTWRGNVLAKDSK